MDGIDIDILLKAEARVLWWNHLGGRVPRLIKIGLIREAPGAGNNFTLTTDGHLTLDRIRQSVAASGLELTAIQ